MAHDESTKTTKEELPTTQLMKKMGECMKLNKQAMDILQ